VKISTDIPLPAKVSGGRPCVYPFAEMTVGSSIVVKPRKGEALESTARRARSAAATWRARNMAAVGFCVRIVEEDGKRIVRCWMTEYAPR
jgi:hypothetical protein